MINRVLVYVSFIGLYSAMTIASANNSYDLDKADNTSKFYVSGTLGRTVIYSKVAAFSRLHATGTAWSAAAGYMQSSTFSYETGVDSFSVKNNNPASINNGTRKNIRLYYAAMNFIYSSYDLAFLNFKLGIGHLNTALKTVSDKGEGMDEVIPYIGIGVGYKISSKIAVQLHYEGLVYGVAGAGQLGMGVIYHF